MGPLSVLEPWEQELVEDLMAGVLDMDDFMDTSAYEKLYEYYDDEMPYSVKKARTQTPDEWILARLAVDIA